jgi:tetratricopeptide (TPR) repeat protein
LTAGVAPDYGGPDPKASAEMFSREPTRGGDQSDHVPVSGGDPAFPLWQLLDPRSRSLPLLEREQELTALRQWQHSSRPIAVRTLVGGAGAGKTRLATEFVAQVAALEPGVWEAGFVGGLDGPWLPTIAARTGSLWRRPTLLVIDDAAVEVQHLGLLLRAAVSPHSEACPPLRLLLLARQADPSQGWLRCLQEDVAALFDPPTPCHLSELPIGPIRQHLWEEVRRAVARASGAAAEALKPIEEGCDEGLPAAACADTAKLLLAAVLAATTGASPLALLQKCRRELAFALADLELDRLAAFAPAHDPAGRRWLAHLTACATAVGGLSANAAAALAEDEEQALRWPNAGLPRVLADRLSRAFPNHFGGGVRVAHELVAGALVLRVLGRPNLGDAGARVIQRLARRWPRLGANFLTRLAGDFAGPCHPEALEWLGLVLDTAEKPQVGWLLETDRVLPIGVPGIRTMTTQLSSRLIDGLQRLVPGTGSRALTAELARLLGRLSWRLADSGRLQAALERAQQAEAFGAELAKAQPAGHRADWASAAEVVACRLSDLGRGDEAVAKARGAEAAFAVLAAQVGAQVGVRAGWAGSLQVVAAVLERACRIEEALEPAAKAVEVYRQLAAEDPGTFLPELAAAESRLAVLLGACDRTAEALEMKREAEGTCRTCRSCCPAWTSAVCAASLDMLAGHLGRSGLGEEALACASNALGTWRALGQSQPAAFLPDLGRALHRLAVWLSEFGHDEEALTHFAEAERVFIQLARVDPGTFLSGLAVTMLDRANALAGVGQWTTALKTVKEAEAMLQSLAEARPQVFLPVWAKALALEGACFRSLPNLADEIEHYGREVIACCATNHTRSTIAGAVQEGVASGAR